MSPLTILYFGISAALMLCLLACIGASIVYHVRAEARPNSERARQTIAANYELDERYDPEDGLLSEEGLALRARGRRFTRVAWLVALVAVVWGILLSFLPHAI
jgi:hypothetical protein